MNKRYLIIKNGVTVGEADLYKEIYPMMEVTRQHFNETIKAKINKGDFKCKNNIFSITDKLN